MVFCTLNFQFRDWVTALKPRFRQNNAKPANQRVFYWILYPLGEIFRGQFSQKDFTVIIVTNFVEIGETVEVGQGLKENWVENISFVSFTQLQYQHRFPSVLCKNVHLSAVAWSLNPNFESRPPSGVHSPVLQTKHYRFLFWPKVGVKKNICLCVYLIWPKIHVSSVNKNRGFIALFHSDFFELLQVVNSLELPVNLVCTTKETRVLTCN